MFDTSANNEHSTMIRGVSKTALFGIYLYNEALAKFFNVHYDHVSTTREIVTGSTE